MALLLVSMVLILRSTIGFALARYPPVVVCVMQLSFSHLVTSPMNSLPSSACVRMSTFASGPALNRSSVKNDFSPASIPSLDLDFVKNVFPYLVLASTSTIAQR